jgi:hypothetical protein
MFCTAGKIDAPEPGWRGPARHGTIHTVDGGAFSINERDQEELWRFLASLMSSEDKLKELWAFASEEPKARGVLTDAAQAEADERGITLVRRAQRRPTRKVAGATL